MMNTRRGKTQSCEICILAGGLSERMGRDKSRLRLGGRSMLGQIRVEAERTGWPVRVIKRDLTPRCGPLGGVYTALKTTRAEAVVFLACDMPFVTAGLIEWLMRESRRRVRNDKGNRDGAFVRRECAVGFPLVLRRRVLRVVERQIKRAALSLQALAAALRARRMRLPPGWAPQLRNVNTPGAWEQARRVWREWEGLKFVHRCGRKSVRHLQAPPALRNSVMGSARGR